MTIDQPQPTIWKLTHQKSVGKPDLSQNTLKCVALGLRMRAPVLGVRDQVARTYPA